MTKNSLFPKLLVRVALLALPAALLMQRAGGAGSCPRQNVPRGIDVPRYNRYSVGKWEGDTLVVTTQGFDDRQWVYQFGYPISDKVATKWLSRSVTHAPARIGWGWI